MVNGKLRCFYKVFKTQSPRYLFQVISTAKKAYITKTDDRLPLFKEKQFQKFFLPFDCDRWNKLDSNFRTCEGFTSFKGNILKFLSPPKIMFFFVIIQKEYYG